MSALKSLFDSFDGAPLNLPGVERPSVSEEDAEAARLAAYENGYRSGWDDCIAAENETSRKVGAELARNLGDLGFTYHEARSQLLGEVEALLEALFTALLPRVLGPALVRRLVDDLAELAEDALDRPVTVVVTPEDAVLVRAMLPEAPTMPVEVVEEQALAEGQAFLRFGQTERKYDLGHLAERLRAALVAGAVPSGEHQRDAG